MSDISSFVLRNLHPSVGPLDELLGSRYGFGAWFERDVVAAAVVAAAQYLALSPRLGARALNK